MNSFWDGFFAKFAGRANPIGTMKGIKSGLSTTTMNAPKTLVSTGGRTVTPKLPTMAKTTAVDTARPTVAVAKAPKVSIPMQRARGVSSMAV